MTIPCLLRLVHPRFHHLCLLLRAFHGPGRVQRRAEFLHSAAGTTSAGPVTTHRASRNRIVPACLVGPLHWPKLVLRGPEYASAGHVPAGHCHGCCYRQDCFRPKTGYSVPGLEREAKFDGGCHHPCQVVEVVDQPWYKQDEGRARKGWWWCVVFGVWGLGVRSTRSSGNKSCERPPKSGNKSRVMKKKSRVLKIMDKRSLGNSSYITYS